MNRKYTPIVERRRQLSLGFLEDAWDEVWSENVFLSAYRYSASSCVCVVASVLKPAPVVDQYTHILSIPDKIFKVT